MAREPAVDVTSATVMLVDDEPTTLDAMEIFLRSEGFSTFLKSTDSSQVLTLLRERRPDLLLLNLMMPGFNGLEVLQAMQSDPALRDIQVILVTGSTDATTKQRALECGATDFLCKPVDPSELALRVRNTLAAKARPRPGVSGELESEAPPNGRSHSRLESNDAATRNIIRRFVDRLRERLVAMERCLEVGDFVQLCELAHWLKGSAGTVGFDAFTAPAETLRLQAHDRKREEAEASVAEIRRLVESIAVPADPERHS